MKQTFETSFELSLLVTYQVIIIFFSMSVEKTVCVLSNRIELMKSCEENCEFWKLQIYETGWNCVKKFLFLRKNGHGYIHDSQIEFFICILHICSERLLYLDLLQISSNYLIVLNLYKWMLLTSLMSSGRAILPLFSFITLLYSIHILAIGHSHFERWGIYHIPS